MKYPIVLIAVASVMLLVGVGIRMHADWRYTQKMYYHTADSLVYQFEDVFAERKLGDTTQLISLLAGVAGAIWLGVARARQPQQKGR